MNKAPLISVLCSALLALAACNQAKSPEDVQSDVSKASDEAAANAAKADATRKQTESQATQDMTKAQADAQTQAVDKSIAAVADQAVTEAEGQNKIALAKCESLSGDAQQQCKDTANAHLKDVKDRAAAAKSPDKGSGQASQ